VSLKLSTRLVGEVTIVNATGRFTLGDAASTFRDNMRDLIAAGHTKLLLNLSDISYIDSSGIGEMVSGSLALSQRGGVMKLVKLTKRVQDMLQITKQYGLFEVFDDEEKALASFQ
jgi:anti-sigma B factor antagonist